MKKLFYLNSAALGLALLIMSCGQSGNQTSESESGSKSEVKAATVTLPDDVTVNLEESKVMWSGTMVGIYTHEGTVDLTEASLQVEDGKVTGGSFTVDLSTMVATDENYNPEEGSTPEKLVGHLMSPDFFDVENHPTASFVITNVADSTLTGDLTVRGITGEETVENVKVYKDGDTYKLKGTLVFNRKEYDVNWDHPIQERVLKNEITVKVKLIAS